jgi:hypothetical protein
MSESDALNTFGALLGTFQPLAAWKKGLLGNGNGESMVADRPGWSWFRLDGEQSKLTQVRNLMFAYFADGTPVWVGKWHYTDKYEQVLGVYWGPYADNPTQAIIDQYRVAPHGATHHAITGSDPAPIDMSNLVNGKVVATSPETLSVAAEFMIYAYGLELRKFPGSTIDLSTHVPAIAGHRYTLVYLNTSTGFLGAIAGTIVPDPAPPDVPLAISGTIPLAIVDQYFGQTTIIDSRIYQWKLLWGAIGGTVPPHTHSDANSGGTSIVGLEELLFACATPLFLVGNAIYPINTYHTLYIPVMYDGLDVEVDLVWIHPDPVHGCGQLLIIRPASPGMYITYSIRVVHGAGNIRLHDKVHVTLDESTDHMLLIYDGSYWCDFI